MAEGTYRQGLPEPALAHEMWSREICDRLDRLIELTEDQIAILVGDRDKPVQVELTEPGGTGEKPAPAKAAPARAAATAKTSTTAKR